MNVDMRTSTKVPNLRAFEAAYEIYKEDWATQQQELINNPNTKPSDKTALVDAQILQLQELLKFHNMGKEAAYIVPIEWNEVSEHPRHKEITNIVVAKTHENGGDIKQFIKGGDIEFGIWMRTTLNLLRVVTYDDEGYRLANQISMQLVDRFIPGHSDAHKYLQLLMAKRCDSNGRLRNNLLICDLFEDIWTEMKNAQVHKKVQLLVKPPIWRHGKDKVENFNHRYDKYLSQRLGVQLVSAYLDSNPALRREYYINYMDCLPKYIRREVKYDITVHTPWNVFLNIFVNAAADLDSDDDDKHKIKNAHNNDNKSRKREYPRNKSYNNYKSKRQYNDNNKSTTNKYQPSNNDGNKDRGNNKPQNNYKSSPQGGYNKKSNYQNNDKKRHYKGNNKYTQNKRQPENKGQQVNVIDVENLDDYLSKKFQEMMVTAKMSALIVICLLAMFIPSTGGELVRRYKWENCETPKIPYFYRLHDEYLKSVIVQNVSLVPVNEDCSPNIIDDMIIGMDIGNNLLVEWTSSNPSKPKEYKYKSKYIQRCNQVINPVILDNDAEYSIIYKNDEASNREAQRSFTQLCQIRLIFISKCPNWDSPIQDDMNRIDNAIQTAYDNSRRITLNSISKIGQYQLPERENNVESLYNEKSYNTKIMVVFNNLRGYTYSLELQVATLMVDKNTLTELLKTKTQALSHSETVKETLRSNGDEVVTLSKSLKEANEKMLKMISKEQHVDAIDRMKAKLETEKLMMIPKEQHNIAVNNIKSELEAKMLMMLPKEQHINAINKIKSELDTEKQDKQTLTKLKDDLSNKNYQCNNEKIQINSELTQCKGNLHSREEELRNKDIEINNLNIQINNINNQNDNNEALQTTNKLYHQAIQEKTELEMRLNKAWANDKQMLQNTINNYETTISNLESRSKRRMYNIEHILNEINNLPHDSGTVNIIKEALRLRLTAIDSYTTVDTPLTNNQPKELKTIKECFEDVIKTPYKRTQTDITNTLNDLVQDIDIKKMGNDYESILTFIGGIITTIVGRIVKEKIGSFVTQRRSNRFDNNSIEDTTHPYSYRNVGIPLISTVAPRTTTGNTRGILVNREGRVGEQVNSISTHKSPSTDSSEWSPHINVTLKDNNYQALIDTGATINVISKRIVDELNLPITAHSIGIETANGNITATAGRVTHSIKIENKNYTVTFEILTDCRHDIIIDNVTIPPGSCTIFHAKVVPNRDIQSNVILDLHPYWKNVDHLLTFEQVGKVHDGIIPIVLVNAGRNPVDLRKDTHIGQVHMIKEINEDTLLVTSEEVIPDDADWEETLPPYPSSIDPIDYDSFIKLIDLSLSILSEKGKQKLLDICWKHKTAFHEYDGKPGLYSGTQSLNIKLKSDKVPTRIKPSRMSIEKETEISKQIADMIETGMIEPSRSPYLSRVVLVRKKDQKWRFVVDFRFINSLIEQQSHVIPRIDKITEEAAGKNFYTSFDLKAGFHQIPLDENSRKIAAFVTHEGIFQYKVMPMGLTGSPDKFQEIMDEVLFRLPNCYVYLDDILTCASDENIHLDNIDAILQRIAEFSMKINIAKCQFGRPSAQYLGFVLDKQGIHPNPEKVKAINIKPIPRTPKEVKSFLGAASYFRRHIKNFSAIAEPLYKLDRKFVWEDTHTEAFNKLKDALSNATTLSPPDNTKNYTIFTDASKQGLGAALVQKDRPIAFASRSLKPAEKNYPIIKLEALGLIYALKQFRPYIYGKHTTVITDHKPLLSLLNNKELTGILQRYQMAIMEYDLTIQYIKGEANTVADYLSRESFAVIDLKEALYEDIFPSKMFPPYNINKFIEYYNEKEKELISNDGKIRTSSGTRVYVPKLLREKLLSVFHSHPFLGGHLGYDKINGKFKSIFYWPKMDEQMNNIWTSCQECQLNKE
uniref:RNA-directed DNA polymerase n=1 Tax=Strongyloides papillosus TaxID=174720 RepID=A0A0N5BYR6_STREA